MPRLEQGAAIAGIGAVLVNCLPLARVGGVAPWLRGFTRLPLGAYANIGQWRDRQWWWEGAPGPAEYAETALGWVGEGMQIVGGCCGVRPAHIAALKAAIAGRASAAPTTFALGPLARGSSMTEAKGPSMTEAKVLGCALSPPTVRRSRSGQDP